MAFKHDIFDRLFPGGDHEESDRVDAPAPDSQQARRLQIPEKAYTPRPAAPAPAATADVADPSETSSNVTRLLDISNQAKAGLKYRDPAQFDVQAPDPSLGTGGEPPQFKPDEQTDSTGRFAVAPEPPASHMGNEYDRARSKAAAEYDAVANMSPRDKAKLKLNNVINRKIVDDDTSTGKRFKEILKNALAGAAIGGRSGGGLFGMLGGAVGGGIGGYVNKNWDEIREAEGDLGLAQRDYDIAQKVTEDDEKLAKAENDREVNVYEAMTKREKDIFEALDKKKQSVLSQLRDIDEIDPADPDPKVQAFVSQAKDAGVIVLPKKKGSKFSFDITPSGDLVVGDTTTGAYKRGEGNYAKSPTIDDKDLPDSLFGLKDDKELDLEADAAITKDFPKRRRRPEMERQLMSVVGDDGQPMYAKDGQLDESKVAPAEIAALYENGPDDTPQRKAAYRLKAQRSQQDRQQAVEKFRLAIKNAPAGNTPVPLQQIVDTFKEVLDIKDPKERKAKLDRYYNEVLPHIRAK